MRRAARVDDNHTSIVDGLRACGWLVHDTSSAGDGFPDLVACGPDGSLWCVEIKSPSKPPSARELTPRQKAFHQRWSRCATLLVVLHVQDVIDAYNRRKPT